MPTYEYECKKCGGAFEHFQRMVDEPLKRCILDGCRGKVIRLMSAGAGVIFKGSGFYETDYKKKSGSKSDSSEKPAPCAAAEDKSCPNAKSCPAAGPDATAIRTLSSVSLN